MADESNKQPACESMPEEEIDETLKESFPASDPPGWTLGIDNHCEDPKARESDDASKKSAVS